MNVCVKAHNQGSTSGSSLSSDDPTQTRGMHAHLYTDTPLIPRVPDVWPQIPPPSGSENHKTTRAPQKQQPNCDRQSVCVCVWCFQWVAALI